MYRMHGATALLAGVKNRLRLPLSEFITIANVFCKGGFCKGGFREGWPVRRGRGYCAAPR